MLAGRAVDAELDEAAGAVDVAEGEHQPAGERQRYGACDRVDQGLAPGRVADDRERLDTRGAGSEHHAGKRADHD